MNYLKIFVSILICQSAGLIGSIFTAKSISSWYQFLNKPSFNPPNWIFGPVWITLYTLMGISLYMVYSKGMNRNDVRLAVIVFLFHLAFNALWSILFFGLRNTGLAFAGILVLLVLIVLIVYLFYKIDKKAAYLLLPYLLWVSFASVLNFSIWRLN